MWKWILPFVVIPAVELYILLQLGSMFGAFETFLLIVLTGTLGGWLAKREGLGVFASLREEASRGIPAGPRLAEGLLVFIGGILLLTPGVLTDFTGFAFIFPLTRRWLAPRVAEAVRSRIQVTGAGAQPDANPFTRTAARETPRPASNTPKPFANPFDDLP